ncbi:DUF983 domain-containing protein [Elstera sp.]|jgi:uncharacterized protein (DUF983 family)|uniref:DUF983 domain-containing protein n=1 Tax=Elstera sp. TaxID=1916664 RepID=UPI0037BFDECC
MTEHFGTEVIVERRSILPAMLKGAKRCCPQCGERRLFTSYLKIAPTCTHCGVIFSDYRADDGPAYFTIFAVGHIIIPGMLVVEQAYSPPNWVHMALWLPMTVLLSLAFLPLIKGAVVGLQWALDVKSDDQR